MEDAKIFQGYYLFQTIMFREGYYLSWAFGKESEAHDHAQGGGVLKPDYMIEEGMKGTQQLRGFQSYGI
ncbi:hypothetical protein OsI_14887 [Oryza sativa Indica Group]|uniref:Uncharacterized protein n=1 Tax=Oryza sativa subsp. indica TaxID=39946 RepID=A2XQH7_ORYSI|nr:hypothetical protein OsI_14887 [Oryza sativa Indica Group]